MSTVKEVFEEKEIKQTWLTEKPGKSYSTVNGYVQKRRQPSLEGLYKIAEILNMETPELLKKHKWPNKNNN